MNAHQISLALGLLALIVAAGQTDATPIWDFRAPNVLVRVADDASEPPRKEESGRMYLGNEPVESCMNRWDPDTHMTKEAWRETCKRVGEEREPYVKVEHAPVGPTFEW